MNLKYVLLGGMFMLSGNIFSATQQVGQDNPCLKLWYNTPAERWMTQALPIGNGAMGAMVFGGVEKEHIQFNEISLWSGKVDELKDENYSDKISNVQNLLVNGKVVEANNLLKDFSVPREHFGAFQPFGDIFMTFDHSKEAEGYVRELDLEKGILSVSYTVNGVKFRREYFASYPDQAVIIRITSDKKDQITALVSKQPAQDNAILSVEGNDQIVLSGEMPQSGLKYCSRLKVVTEGGTVKPVANEIQVKEANSLTLFLSAATDYAMEWPVCRSGIDPKDKTHKVIRSIGKKPYKEIQKRHLDDYQSLFNRTKLELANQKENLKYLPTDKMLQAYTGGSKPFIDPTIEALLFNYGRYLLISSSRRGSLPANLQGVWNNKKRPSWDSDYHTDINLEMNYWLAGSTNLQECFIPLVDYVDFLRVPGKRSAKKYFNARGFYVNIYTNPWGYAELRWLWPGASGWLCQNLYDSFLYSGDTKYLRDKIYPIMRDAALFYLDILKPYYKTNKLVVTPSISPETGFFFTDGNIYRVSAGAAIDQQIVYDLFTNTIEAAGLLNVDQDLVKQLSETLDNLSPPIQINKSGDLQEWVEDWNAQFMEHRHLSHLYALYPGRMISPLTTPDWANAAEKTIFLRGDYNHTEWSVVWKIAMMARLGKKEKAYSYLKHIIKHSTLENEAYPNRQGTYENLLTSSAPLQLDGNYGYTAAIAEMLFQSHVGNWKEGYRVHLLPALPANWRDGSVTGLLARGGFEVSMEWQKGKLLKACIHSKQGNPLKIAYEGKVVDLAIKKGSTIFVDGNLNQLGVSDK